MINNPEQSNFSIMKIAHSETKPSWISELPESGGWAIVPGRTVEDRQLYQLKAFNPRLGLNGVSMSIIEQPNSFGDTLSQLDTWEIMFDDFDPVTTHDASDVGLINLSKTTSLTPDQLVDALTNKDSWEELGNRYANRFLSLDPNKVDVSSLFQSKQGIDTLIRLIFPDLFEVIDMEDQRAKNDFLSKHDE